MTTRLPNTFQTVATEQTSAFGASQLLGYGKYTPQSEDFLHDEVSLFEPKGSQLTVRNYHIEHFDLLPNQTPAFNGPCTFDFGQHIGSALLRIDVIFQVGPTAAGVKWRDWIGELLMGQDIVLKYGQNFIKRYSADQFHCLQRLSSKQASPQDAAYRQKVGADLSVADSVGDGVAATVQNEFIVPLWLPISGALNELLPVAAFPRDFRLEFRIPAYASLVRGEPGVATTLPGTAPTTLNVRLRVTSLHQEVDERASMIDSTMADGGLTWFCLDNQEHENEEWDFTGAAAVTTELTRTVKLQNITNPATMLYGMVRYNADLNDADGTLPTAAPADSATPAVCAPLRYQGQPYTSCALYDHGKRVTPLYTLKWIEEHFIPEHFQCELGEYIFVIPFSVKPLHSSDALGHMNINAMTNPEFRITMQARPGATYASAFGPLDPWNRSLGAQATTATYSAGLLNKRLDVYLLVRNIAQAVKGVFLLYYK